ncbi:MAG: sulfatase modifying factor 1 [Myxococcota bacterium]|jgi:sulfatase modifying factor 1
MWLALVIACAELPEGTVRYAPVGDGETASAPTLGEGSPAHTGDTGATRGTADTGRPMAGPCPPEMVQVEGFCIDAWEAHLVDASPFDVASWGVAASAPGEVPQGYISGDVAEAACVAAGKRLCSSAEWLWACQGAEGRTYPYGPEYDPDACNDTRAVHPVVELFGADADWSPEQMNDPRLNQLPDSLHAAGAFPDCATPEGVFDLHGNLHEWVTDAEGVFRGGFYVDAVINGPGCGYATTAHSREYHDYSTGFRCCSDP